MQCNIKTNALAAAVSLALMGAMETAHAGVNVQCPGDTDGDAVIDDFDDPKLTARPDPSRVKCLHFTAGDGFVEMADDHPTYIFGFSNITGTMPDDAIAAGMLNANWPGPTIEVDQGDELFLSLTNVGTVMRPDLFDPHTVHYHGFPNAATVFDGVPEVSVSINMGSTLTYYYNNVEPGTYMYHCHVEATEHMEMGMLANLYVHPLQDEVGCFDEGPGGVAIPNGNCPVGTRKGGTGPNTGYVYNDNDGTTAYHVEAPLQFSGFDGEFHDASILVQPLPFADIETNYPQINGRGYPDTIKTVAADPSNPGPGEIGAPTDQDGFLGGADDDVINNGNVSSRVGSLVQVPQGQKLLLRLSNVSIDRFFTVTAHGLKMKIVGTGARLMRGTDGKNLYVDTTSVNFGGGETHDVIIDTADVAAGTYFLTATEFYQMSNKTQLDGGLITEIVINN